MKELNNLVDLRSSINMANIETYVRDISQRINSRLWIASPFIGEENLFYTLFNISKIKKHNPKFRLITDLKHISMKNYKVLEFFINTPNAELRTLEHLHSKLYIMDNYSVVTSANLTYYGFYVNYETAVAGDVTDIARYEQLYNELWNLGTTISNQEELQKALETSDFEDIESFSPNVKPLKPLPKELTQKCGYEQFLNEFNKLSEKYLQYGRTWNNTSLKFEIDSFLNYLFHHNPIHNSQGYYYINEINHSANDLLLKTCINEYKEWLKTDIAWDNENVRETYKNNALKLFADDKIDKITIEEISDFLKSNINTYLTNAVRFDWGNKFIQKNKIENVREYIIKLKKSSPKEIDKLVKNSTIAYMGESTLQELLGLIREDLPIRNENTNAGLRYLGYKV